jgi:hypothetical protein
MPQPPLYTLPFAEVERRAAAGEQLISAQGYPLSTRDRKFDAKYAIYIWSADVDNAIAKGLLKPEDSPKLAKPLVNAKGKPFTWSYTALTAFETCPASYAAERFYCTSVFQETEAIKWGNRKHAAGEQYLKQIKVTEPDLLDDIRFYCDAMRKAQAAGAELLVEQEIALNENMKPVSWFAKDAWFRGKLDATVIREGKASIFDWKSGKVKNDPDQLRIFAAALSIIRPDVNLFAPKFIFTREAKVVGCDDIAKSEIPGIWEGVLGRVERMKQAWAADNFPARASGLCPWCSIYQTCKYARRK